MNAPSTAAETALPDWLAAHDDVLSAESSMDYLARHSHSFRYAARFLPAPYDTLIADVYAFCRFTDDLVDAAGDVPPAVLRERLDVWRELARQAHAGRPTGLRLLDRPLTEMGRRGIPFALAEDLIAGVAMDLEPRRYATLRELDAYSYRVASVVGLWLTRLVGIDHPAVLERATDLGHAMQLTNILRDVGEDWARGRLYLPLDVLTRHRIRESDIEAAVSGGGLPRGWEEAMEELMADAEVRYARAIEAISALPVFFRKPVMVAAYVYRDIHTALRRNGHDNLHRRAHTGLWRKVWLGGKARLRLALAPPFHADGAVRSSLQAAPTAMAPAGVLAELAQPGRIGVLAFVVAVALAAAAFGNPRGTAGEESRLRPSEQAADAASAREARAERSPEATMRRDLQGVEEALRRQPHRVDLHLNRLRLLHTLSVQDAALLPVARAARAELESVATAGDELDALLLAYRGALEVVEARHAFWPRERMEPLRRGLPLLDSAVARAPRHAEIRYLRLTSGYYLPFFLGRKPEVREDFDALAALLPRVRGEIPPRWYVAIADFVLENGELPPARRDPLRRARAEAAADLRLSSADQRSPRRATDWSATP